MDLINNIFWGYQNNAGIIKILGRIWNESSGWITCPKKEIAKPSICFGMPLLMRGRRNLSETKFSEEKIAYLQLLQEPIGRMSSTSAIFKGFSAAIVSGIAALSFVEINRWVLVLAFLPLLCFAFMDCYYLWEERKFKYIYEQVRTDKRSIDYSLSIQLNREERKAARMTIGKIITSISIWPFYVPVIAIAVVITMMKFKEAL